MTAETASALRRFYDRPYLLLSLTALIWGANGIAGRIAVGQISPMALITLRWIFACSLIASISWRHIRADWPLLRARLPQTMVMGVLGFTVFNALFYLAAHYTTAVNMTILQGSIPGFVLVGAFFIHGTPIRPFQLGGMLLAAAGVALVACGGDFDRLRALSFNFGDLLLILACVLYAGYTIALKDRPKVSGLGFLGVMAIAAVLTSLPLLGLEMAMGATQWPTLKGWGVVGFVAIFPSFLSQLFFMRGVELIGPGRAGVFVNLVPVFGAVLAVAILGEPFGWYHGAALVLVIGGIVWAQRR